MLEIIEAKRSEELEQVRNLFEEYSIVRLTGVKKVFIRGNDGE